MIELFAAATPNGLKPIIALEMLGLAYELHAVDLKSGAQRTPEFLAMNPNGKIPVMIDRAAPDGPFALSESAAILVYLAEKTGRLLPESGAARARVFEQLFLHASGLAPAFGNAGWFMGSAPEQLPIAIDRFRNEARRVLGVIDAALQKSAFVAGESLTIADIAHFGWLWRSDYIGLALSGTPSLARWYARMAEQPAVARAIDKTLTLARA